MPWAAISANVAKRSPASSRSAADGMGGDRRLEQLLGLGEALDVVDVGVRGDQRLALAEREIELADQLDAVVDRVLVADVDERPVGLVVDQVDAAADPPPGLVIQLDDVRKQRGPLEHRAVAGSRGGGA